MEILWIFRERVRGRSTFVRRVSIGQASRRLPSYFHQNQHNFRQKASIIHKIRFRTILKMTRPNS